MSRLRPSSVSYHGSRPAPNWISLGVGARPGHTRPACADGLAWQPTGYSRAPSEPARNTSSSGESGGRPPSGFSVSSGEYWRLSPQARFYA